MADACIHGFAPGTCLICQTLDKPQPPRRGAATTGATAGTQGGTLTSTRRPASPAHHRVAGGLEPPSRPRVVPREAPRTGSAAVKVGLVIVAVVAAIVVAWVALHLVLVVVHILELIGVAVIALYVGWVAGVHHGHKMASRE
ncbi:MAG TPA: hypothetical protein VHT30_03240 [Acidimicrobiales bacterium]|nr:hypothetical protein [Acidimicrobiales bacterium]